MIAARRTRYSFALQRAMQWAEQFERPLLVLEPLRAGYLWASDRLHRFVIEGMRDNAAQCNKHDVFYYPYVEPKHGAGRGLLAALAEHAAVLVTDEYPAFFLPHMVAAAGKKLPVRLESIDGNGLLPMRAAQQAFPTAYAFRRFLQKTLPGHLGEQPLADPLARAHHAKQGNTKSLVAKKILERWPSAESRWQDGSDIDLSDLPIDHTVGPASFAGGSHAAAARWRAFAKTHFEDYASGRNQPDDDVSSGLSPYLHFGHIGAHEIFADIVAREEWDADRLTARASGKRTGWWRMSEPAEAFLDQLITWRELGFNMCSQRPDFDQYESLPPWAQSTLAQHARDRRPTVYTLAEFEQAGTHDPLWNAAQRQLVRDGRLHNYLRMLWGKKILEWTTSPREALAVMIELNNKYAVDGRDPNSYSGIFWTLGRYDRPWGPERKIFGTIRYMSSDNTARKLRVTDYLRRYATDGPDDSVGADDSAAADSTDAKRTTRQRKLWE